jgi:hypothetical protein
MIKLLAEVRSLSETETLLKVKCLKTKRMDEENISARKQIRCKRVFGKKILDKVSLPNSILMITLDWLATTLMERETVNSFIQT